MLSSEEIRQNYEKSIDLALEILNEHYFDHNLSINDWAESLIGSELVVKLIQSVPFDAKVYRTCLLQSFQQLKHVLYLDVDKRFYPRDPAR